MVCNLTTGKYIAHFAAVPGNLAHAFDTYSRASHSARYTAFAKGVRVKATHLGYRKTIKSVSHFTPRQYKFDCAELGGMVTVEAYFLRSKCQLTSVYGVD